MSTPANSRRKGATKSWWAYRKNRNKVWLGLAAVGILALGALVWSLSNSGGMMNAGAVPVGQKVDAVKLEDSRTGQTFDLGQYLGKKDIVLVAYMGEFCLGCSELIGGLQQRAGDFSAADASLVVLGSETGQTGRRTAQKHGVAAYPLLQEGGQHTFTRSIGMWSDHMSMPWMGYVIIDKSGKVVASEQMGLSEARGAAQQNVDKLLAALQKARGSAIADSEPLANALAATASR